MTRKHVFYLFIYLCLCNVNCRPPLHTPKPTGYFVIDTPQKHEYTKFDLVDFPYTFEYPNYCLIQKDSLDYKKESTETNYWINLVFPDLNGMINITYKNVSKEQPLDKLNAEAFEMSFFHHEKASYIEHSDFWNEFGNKCSIYTLGGNVATRYQFTATDSTKHFLRGALYFNVTPNFDSLKPASEFILQDIKHILATLKWKN